MSDNMLNDRFDDLSVTGEPDIDTSSLRSDNPAPSPEPQRLKAKAPIPRDVNTPAPPAPEPEKTFTLAEVMAMSKQIEHNIRKALATGEYVPGATQVVAPDKAPSMVLDFSKLTIEDIYDLSIPIPAKTFGATDALKVTLKDSNYEPRWVNKNPRRLGSFMNMGFVYVEKADLNSDLAIEVTTDAQGHFVLEDVVLMRIPKQLYFGYLRAAHERAVRTVNPTYATKAAEKEAVGFMSKTGGSEFANAASENKISFYRPGIEI